MAALGHPVPKWELAEVDETLCSVGPMLHGAPVAYGEHFAPEFADALARVLFDLHHLEADGCGPLVDDRRTLRGRSPTVRSGMLDRWYHARVWPFDATDLGAHVIAHMSPELTASIEPLREAILAAADGAVGALHSDHHSDHLLRDPGGGLAALLDFGDAFVDSLAWDFALLHWYYGNANTGLVTASYPGGAVLDRRGRRLAVAVGLYKLAKTPTAVHCYLASAVSWTHCPSSAP